MIHYSHIFNDSKSMNTYCLIAHRPGVVRVLSRYFEEVGAVSLAMPRGRKAGWRI